MLLKEVADAFAASRKWDAASLNRLAFWVDVLGDRTIIEVTADQVDDAIVRLAERGSLRAGRRRTEPSGEPLKGATVNRYVSTIGSVYRFARGVRLIPRTFMPPTRGIERLPEPGHGAKL